MSTVTAVGPALDLDGPLPVAPEYTLLSIPGVVVEEGEGPWLMGVVLDGYPVDTPFSWEPCSTGTARVKEEGGDMPLPRFDAIGLYIPITCSGIGIGERWRAFAERAAAVLRATISFGVEQALAAGVAGSTNPFLGDTNVDVLASGAAVSPAVGLSYLEQALGATGRQGIIHAPREVTAAWGFDKLETGEVLRTVNGTPVAAGGGYSGVPADGDDPADGESYAFVTGPVEVRLSPMQLIGDNINGTLDTSNNDVTFRAEQFALVTWDTALQAAVLIDWSPT